MLLQRLTEQADRLEGLPPEFYRPRQIHWVLTILDGGARAHLANRRPPKGTKEAPFAPPVPFVQRSGTKVLPYLLVDTAEFVLGRAKHATAPDGPTEKGQTEAERRHTDYLALVRRWADSAPSDPAAVALLAFLGGGIADLQMPEDLDARDTIAIMVDSTWLHDLPSAKGLWAQVVRERKGGAAEQGLCLVCGELGSLLATIPEPVKKGAIPSSSGGSNEAQLVSVNTAAQGRGGAIQLVNTPVCDRCGGRSMAALNHLLASDAHRRRFADGVMVWWTREPVEQPLIALLDDPGADPATAAVVAHLIDVLHDRPTPAALRRVNANDFYALTLGLNNARTVIREWLDIPLAEVEANLGAWFEDHGVFDGWAGTIRYTPLWLLALATGRHSSGQYVKGNALHGIERDLLLTALRGTPPPARLLPHLLQRIRADRRIDTPRIALLHLALSRPHHRTDRPVPSLDPTSTDPAYLCGRTFAVLEAIQRTALRDVNTTISDKYFGTAMTAPASVLATLRRGANAHLKRLRRDNAPAFYALETRLAQVFGAFTDDPPTHLTPVQQARFVIGYEQQRAADLAAAKAAKDARAAKGFSNANDAPQDAAVTRAS
ncbi:type I-C CRISPR-associated protein Cas8c/Csd1 [Streptacidiphilus fuscans]|uniref:Type I-C CRISPR-associated protein Cas8c/Csd1 n=1 Tax=Streptacidiphilus fuscans TaxID=2789292 RepID=A0A931B9A6_9ACTN|nr:type I-C CRISPR-associated protein Cas8c/Csd1 [Streptacidiphilus fuscans]MBF9071887.1 type I-C CRISPR-associated protein Cas8c/Csd1 [Streptacidiphilus fuscans]